MQTAKSHEAGPKKSSEAAAKTKPQHEPCARPQHPSNPLWNRLALQPPACAAGVCGISALQRDMSAGTAAYPLGLQPKLMVGATEDPYEEEAEQIADRIMRMPAATIQPKPT